MSKDMIINKQGIGFCGIFFVTLFLLKIGVVKTTVMEWSWIWIFAPLWGPVTILIGILLLIGIVTLVMLFLGRKKR